MTTQARLWQFGVTFDNDGYVEVELPPSHEDRGWTDYQMARGLGWTS